MPGGPGKRHHVRFWRWDELYEDRPAWFGAATFDKGVGLSHPTGQVTHHIAPEVDAERDRLAPGYSRQEQCRRSTGWMASIPECQGKNGGGDPWHTDGRLAVVMLRLAEAQLNLSPRAEPAIYSPTSSTEGAVVRRREAGRGAAPRVWFAGQALGRRRAPPVPTTRPCQELADDRLVYPKRRPPTSLTRSVAGKRALTAKARPGEYVKSPSNSMRFAYLPSACGAPRGARRVRNRHGAEGLRFSARHFLPAPSPMGETATTTSRVAATMILPLCRERLVRIFVPSP